MTKKEIKDLAKKLLDNMNTVPLEMDVAMDDKTLDVLSTKIVARFSQLRELVTWHDNLYNMSQLDWDFIDMTEEEELLSELAKLMTQLDYHTELEEYEACARIKKEIDKVNDKLSKL